MVLPKPLKAKRGAQDSLDSLTPLLSQVPFMLIVPAACCLSIMLSWHVITGCSGAAVAQVVDQMQI